MWTARVRIATPLRLLRLSLRFAVEAFWEFVADDGWAIASHIALSALMSLFPFFLVLKGLTGASGQVLTVGVLLALYFASSGIESLRIGLNRAYNMVDSRPIWLMRLESIGYVILAAVALLALSLLVVLAP